MEATRFMGRTEEDTNGPVGSSLIMEENDEVDRLSLQGSLWMAARVQVCRCVCVC
jgi:hypothetical protein